MNKSSDIMLVKRTFRGVLTAQLFSFLAQFVALVVDGVVIGKCPGTDNLAAYGFSSTIVSIVVAFAGFTMTGVSIICARSIGNTKNDAKESIFTTCMVFAGLLSVVLTIVIVGFSSQWASLVGASGSIRDLTASYIRGYGIGIIPLIMVASLFPIMQLDGDRNRMTVSFVAMAFADIVLDLVNGFVIKGGIFGMGLATSISSVVAMLIMLGHFVGRETVFRFRISSFKASHIPEIIIFGYMYIVKQFFMALLAFICNRYLQTRYGTDMVAVYAAIISAGRLFLCVGMATGNTVSILTGVYAGEEDARSLRKMMKVAISDSLIVNGVLTVIAVLVATPLVSAYFRERGELLDTTVAGFRIYIILMAFRSVNLCLRGYYQGMKKQVLTLCLCFFQNFACTLVCMLVLDMIFGITGVWIAFVAGEAMTFLLFVLYSQMKCKGKSGILEKLLFIPHDFETGDRQSVERTLTSMDDVMNFSREVPDFCRNLGATDKQANEIALAIEELAGNIVRWGFNDHKSHAIDTKVELKNDVWMIRLRDDCAKFNPVKYLDEREDSPEHNGIKMTVGRAKEFSYMNTLNMNNLIIKV